MQYCLPERFTSLEMIGNFQRIETNRIVYLCISRVFSKLFDLVLAKRVLFPDDISHGHTARYSAL